MVCGKTVVCDVAPGPCYSGLVKGMYAEVIGRCRVQRYKVSQPDMIDDCFTLIIKPVRGAGSLTGSSCRLWSYPMG